MSWQTPGKEPPPDPAAPEPDAETTRVPLQPATPGSGSEPPAEAPATPPADASPTPGLISAAPVGWAGPDRPATSPGDGPAVPWAPPVKTAATPVTEGLVIAGVFSRLVAYSIDIAFLQLLNLAVLGLVGGLGENADSTVTLAVAGLFVAVDFLYFVGLWTSGWHGTLGMRLLRLRILGATSATTLSANDALLRWIALSGAVSILTLVPGVGRYIGLIAALWVLVLFISTATNPLRQGLHDRWARSVIVQPAPGGSGAAVIGCIVLLVAIFVVLPIALLALVGDQFQDILTEIGRSV